MKLAIFIPARGGQQSIHRKNLIPVCGVPMIVRAVEKIQELIPGVSVYVSTEDAEIAGVARSSGATIIYRPAELSQPDSDVKWAAKHACEEWTEMGVLPDAVIHHEGNLILSDDDYVRNFIKVVETRPDISGIQPIRDVGWGKRDLYATRRDDGLIESEYLFGQFAAGNRQQTESEWMLTCGLCMWRPSNFQEWPDFGPCWYMGRRIYGLPTESTQAIHIDTLSDLAWAEFCLSCKGTLNDRRTDLGRQGEAQV